MHLLNLKVHSRKLKEKFPTENFFFYLADPKDQVGHFPFFRYYTVELEGCINKRNVTRKFKTYTQLILAKMWPKTAIKKIDNAHIVAKSYP